MMSNNDFLNSIKNAFLKYLETGPRSNEKLKILHSAITADLSERLGGKYQLFSLNTDPNKSQEKNIEGRYMEKKVDITVEKDGEIIAGIAVKFVMSNYSQNNVNYFESMLGETANIRSNQIPYFQILILPDYLPYFDRSQKISKWESLSEHHLAKYIKLSSDNIDNFMHTPNKTLIFAIHLTRCSAENKKDYRKFYQNNNFTLTRSSQEHKFEKSVIYNDYEQFADKIVHAIKSV